MPAHFWPCSLQIDQCTAEAVMYSVLPLLRSASTFLKTILFQLTAAATQVPTASDGTPSRCGSNT